MNKSIIIFQGEIPVEIKNSIELLVDNCGENRVEIRTDDEFCYYCKGYPSVGEAERKTWIPAHIPMLEKKCVDCDRKIYK